MRRCGQQDECVRPCGQQLGEPGPSGQSSLARTGGDVVALVDDDDVPPGVLQVIAILQIALEGVDRDDAAVEVIEWVVVGWNAVAHARQPHGVQPHQRDGEAAPPLLLELRQHRLLADDQDALAAATLDQLGSQDAGFQCLAEADCVGDQDPRTRPAQGLQRRVELVGYQVHHGAMAEMNLFVIGDAAASEGFQVKDGCIVGRAEVRHQLGPGGVEDLDLAFERREEQRRRAADQVRGPIDREKPSAIGGRVGAAYEPFLVTNDDAGSGGKGKQHGYRG
jgi:hypothetical protein